MHQVNAGVWAEALLLADGHVGLLQVISPTVVIVHNQPYRPGQPWADRAPVPASPVTLLPIFRFPS